MLKRIDGIYRCYHPQAYISLEVLRVTCPDCPYVVRPSHLTVGGILQVINIPVQQLTVDADNDRFMIGGRYV